MRRFTVLAVVGLLLVAPVVPAMASTIVAGNPEVQLTVADDTFRANEKARLTVVATNDGDIDDGGVARFEDQVQTARSVEMRVRRNAVPDAIEVKTGTVTTGSLGPGGSAEFGFDLEIGDVEPGTYTVPVEVSYRHARAILFDETPSGPAEIEYTWLEKTRTVDLTIRIEERAKFDVVSEETNRLFAGDTGSLGFTVENTGSRTARNATVQLTSGASGLFFGNPANPSGETGVFVRSLAPGETRRVSVQVGADADLPPGTYPVDTVVVYRDQNDIGARSDTLTTGVAVRPERTFAIEALSTANFRVDESEARLTGRLVNTGPATARNVVVRMENGGPVTPTNDEAAVGTLEPGESAAFGVTAAIAGDAEPGVNSFSFQVEYENADGDLRTASNPIRKSVRIGQERERFQVENVSTTVTPGGTARLSARVRYVGDEPISAVNARLFTSDPLSTADDDAFLGAMDPGETTTATFRISASGDAIAKAYAAAIEVRYDEADGDTAFTDSLPIGVAVNEPSGGPPLLPIAVAALVVLAVAGGLWYRRR